MVGEAGGGQTLSPRFRYRGWGVAAWGLLSWASRPLPWPFCASVVSRDLRTTCPGSHRQEEEGHYEKTKETNSPQTHGNCQTSGDHHHYRSP